VKRASAILKQLEADNATVGTAVDKPNTQNIDKGYVPGTQLSFFQLDDPVLCQIRDEILGLDIDELKPLDALNKLNDIKTILTGGK
jgi:DNA mismatch repair protein MutS